MPIPNSTVVPEVPGLQYSTYGPVQRMQRMLSQSSHNYVNLYSTDWLQYRSTKMLRLSLLRTSVTAPTDSAIHPLPEATLSNKDRIKCQIISPRKQEEHKKRYKMAS